MSKVHGTRPYLPDEYLRGRKISTKVDTYSFGIVLFELCTGLRAYDHQREQQFLRDHVELTDLRLLSDAKAGPECLALFMPLMHLGIKCSATNAKERPEMVQVLKDLDHLALQTEEYVNRKASLPVPPAAPIIAAAGLVQPAIPVLKVHPPTPQIQSPLPPKSAEHVSTADQASSAQPTTISEDHGLPDLDRILNLSTVSEDAILHSEGMIPNLSALNQSESDVIRSHSPTSSSSSTSIAMSDSSENVGSGNMSSSASRPTKDKELTCLK